MPIGKQCLPLHHSTGQDIPVLLSNGPDASTRDDRLLSWARTRICVQSLHYPLALSLTHSLAHSALSKAIRKHLAAAGLPPLLPSLSSQMIIGATRRKDRANFLGGVSATTVAMYGYDHGGPVDGL